MTTHGMKIFTCIGSRILLSNIRNGYKFRFHVARNLCTEASSEEEKGRDPAPFFFNEDVQQMLKKLTRIDLKKTYRARKEGSELKEPEYKFMTTEELEKTRKEAWKKVEERLQIPPVLRVKPEVHIEISKDPELQGYCDHKFIFTDITYGISNEERLIVAREPDGILRHARNDERFRCNQIYFPIPGRKLRTPHMFESEYLERLLDEGEYEFVLDRACIQFDPDSEEFCQVRDKTFSHIEKARQFSRLRSTRHFGALAFCLAWNKSIDILLTDIISDGRLDEGRALVELFIKLHPTSEIAQAASQYVGDDIGLIKLYVASGNCGRRGQLELAIQTQMELQQQKEELAEGVLQAHGTAPL